MHIPAEEVIASAGARELLAVDAALPELRLADHPLWRQIFRGELAKPRLARLLLALLPTVAGPGRYVFAAKISTLSPEDGKTLFRQLYEALKNPEANADRGWRRVLAGLGIPEADIDRTLAEPSAEAEDFLDVVRGHGLSSSSASAAAIAWAIERQLPPLLGELADALIEHYGATPDAVAYLRYEAARTVAVEGWIAHLIETHFAPADPYAVYEARRSAREAVWAWTVLIESV
jgi:hypothetical protein